MVYSYDRRSASGQQDVEKWRSDLRRMTKIYKSIPTAPEDKQLDYYTEARELFQTFRKNFESWVYDELLTSRDPKKQDWREKQVAKSTWTAIISLSNLFPSRWNYRTDQHEPSVSELARLIERDVTRYQRAFNTAFKDIDDLIKEKQESGKETLPATEVLRVGPAHVVIHNAERDRGDEEDLDDELRNLADAIHKIERAGFPGAVKDLVVHVSFVQTNLVAGQYNAEKDELYLFPLGTGRENSQTLVHELGHRFYFRELPSNAKAHWKEVIEGRSLTIDAGAVDHMVNIYVKPYTQKHNYTPGRAELHGMIHEESVELRAKLLELEQHVPSFTSDPEEIREFWRKNYIGTPVLLEEITDYGATNEKEAFAEAFMLYVTKGPRGVGPWTRWFFETISRAGGAKLAYRVVQRYLESLAV